METNITKTIVLDFYGIPGSGKTTISHEIAEKYRIRGKRVIEPSYDLDHKKKTIIRRIEKLGMTIWLFFFRHSKFCYVKDLIVKNGYSCHYDQTKQIVNLATKYFSLNFFSGKYDYLIFDEGIAQASISLSVNGYLTAEENFYRIIKIIDNLPDTALISTKINTDDALRRIKNRNSKDTRIEEKKTEQEREELMTRYEQSVEQIGKMILKNGIIRLQPHEIYDIEKIN